MLDAVSNNAARPADTVAREYLKTRRYIGSADRRALSERVWGILRRRARLDWWLARQGAEPTARARVLADLALTDGATPEQANRLLDGRPHHPYPLSPDERGLIGALSGRSLFHHDMPESVRGEYPDWLEPLLREAFGDTMPAEVAALRDEAAVDLRANSLKCDREQAIAALAAEGVPANAQVEFTSRDQKFHSPVGAAPEIAVRDAWWDQRSGRFSADIEVSAAGQPGTRARMTGRVFTVAEVPVLVRQINRGEVITAQDVRVEQMREAFMRQDVVLD
ncbi:MAG: hypothetical protein HQL40_06105, partial [Alphaproteobacteria bacterium]|nr:hypothetical protein [Alphaproteobacteria bacterium]